MESDTDYAYIIKIITSIIAGLIAIAEIWEYKKKKKNKKWQKLKKPLIISLSMLIILLSVWNTIDEESKDEIAEQARDSLIVKDSIRIDRIYRKSDTILVRVGNTFTSITNMGSRFVTLDSFVGETNKRLDSTLKKSEKMVELEKIKLDLMRPKMLTSSKNCFISKTAKDSTSIVLNVETTNNGESDVLDLTIDIALIFAKFEKDSVSAVKSFSEKIEVKRIIKNAKFNISRILNQKKYEIENFYNLGYLVLRFRYSDEIGYGGFDENSFIKIHVSKENGIYFSELNRNLEFSPINIIKELKLNELLSKSNE